MCLIKVINGISCLKSENMWYFLPRKSYFFCESSNILIDQYRLFHCITLRSRIWFHLTDRFFVSLSISQRMNRFGFHLYLVDKIQTPTYFAFILDSERQLIWIALISGFDAYFRSFHFLNRTLIRLMKKRRTITCKSHATTVCEGAR